MTGDGTFERSFQIVQGNSGDVLKIIEQGRVDEEIRYSLWGEPRIVTWFADINHDGAVDGDDAADFFALWDNGDGLADVNGENGVDGDDVILFFEWWDAGQGNGLTLADNRFGFRGYVWDDHLKLYHVRHRVYDPTPGPAGMARRITVPATVLCPGSRDRVTPSVPVLVIPSPRTNT